MNTERALAAGALAVLAVLAAATAPVGCRSSGDPVTIGDGNIDSWTLPNGYGTCGGIDNP